ncbi:Ubiquitin-associated/translation elongation factor EF1B protein [Raphanus sativus]|nr:Ubiquitin-associated/translation elongation factor EF1B protein [Raphanus sativus]
MQDNSVFEKMSTVSKTTPRDKKVVNDSHKAPSIGETTGGAYNLLLETVESTSPSSLHNNGRFRNIDDSDSTGADCDSVSNNGSWSGDLEDHKEKAAPSTATAKQETIPGAADK